MCLMCKLLRPSLQMIDVLGKVIRLYTEPVSQSEWI